jgi:hypothetical protein
VPLPTVLPPRYLLSHWIDVWSSSRFLRGRRKKYYSLPKNLLCYYFYYFGRCFNGNFLKGKNQTLTLEDDVVEELEALLEYMFSGESVSPDALNISQSCQTGLQRCMSFSEYADKHGMSGASATVHDALQDILPRTFKYSSGAVIGPVHIKTIFNHTPPHSPLRPLTTKAALSTAGITGNTIRKQEREREGLLWGF